MSSEHDQEADDQGTMESAKGGNLKETIIAALICFIVFSVLAEFGCAPRNLRS